MDSYSYCNGDTRRASVMTGRGGAGQPVRRDEQAARSMAVVAVPFILYLVRFCSSKSCTRTRNRPPVKCCELAVLTGP